MCVCVGYACERKRFCRYFNEKILNPTHIHLYIYLKARSHTHTPHPKKTLYCCPGAGAPEVLIWERMGSRKAAVLPEPVCAHAIRSLLLRTTGMEYFCTGVGRVYLHNSMFEVIISPSSKSLNCMQWCGGGDVVVQC